MVNPKSLKGWQWVREEVVHDVALPVGTRIKTIRVAMRLTQQQLADRIGAGVTSLAGWEQNRTEPWPVYLYRLAQVFHCSMDQLYAAGASWEPYQIQPQPSNSVPCRGASVRGRDLGRPCRRWTRNSSGRCHWHSDQQSTSLELPA